MNDNTIADEKLLASTERVLEVALATCIAEHEQKLGNFITNAVTPLVLALKEARKNEDDLRRLAQMCALAGSEEQLAFDVIRDTIASHFRTVADLLVITRERDDAKVALVMVQEQVISQIQHLRETRRTGCECCDAWLEVAQKSISALPVFAKL